MYLCVATIISQVSNHKNCDCMCWTAYSTSVCVTQNRHKTINTKWFFIGSINLQLPTSINHPYIEKTLENLGNCSKFNEPAAWFHYCTHPRNIFENFLSVCHVYELDARCGSFFAHSSNCMQFSLSLSKVASAYDSIALLFRREIFCCEKLLRKKFKLHF